MRNALVGDAAHVPTPMTGSGFSASLYDAEAIASGIRRSAVPAALRDYERRAFAQCAAWSSRASTSAARLQRAAADG